MTDRRVALEIDQRLKTKASSSVVTREDWHICSSQAQHHLDIDEETHRS